MKDHRDSEPGNRSGIPEESPGSAGKDGSQPELLVIGQVRKVSQRIDCPVAGGISAITG